MERKIMLVGEITEDPTESIIKIKVMSSDNELLFTVVQNAVNGSTTLLGADGEEI